MSNEVDEPMQLEPIDSPFTDVLGGVAFTMIYGGSRVVVIIANETLVRMNIPENPSARDLILRDRCNYWHRIANAKFVRREFESRGARVRILPRDLDRFGQEYAMAG